MPNKNIYIADADIPLFTRIQSLTGGSLSTAIAQAVREYITHHSTSSPLFEDVMVTVHHESGLSMKKQFQGRLLAKCRLVGTDPQRILTYQVYLTPKQHWVVYWRDVPAFWYVPSKQPRHPQWNYDWDDDVSTVQWGTYIHQQTDYTYHLDIYDTWEEAQARLPGEIIERVRQTLAGGPPDIEVLDI